MKAFLLAILLLLLLTSCRTATINHFNPHVFRMNLGAEPPSLDPARISDLYSANVELNLMQGLTRFDQSSHAEPAIASHWEISPDKLTYTFHLRPDARWSDGKPVTSHDFLYAWQRALNPATGSDYAFFLFTIKNAKAYYDGHITQFNQVGVSAPDTHTLVVQLAHPVPFFLELMASTVALPLRQDLIE